MIARRIRIRVPDDALNWWTMNDVTIEPVEEEGREFMAPKEYILDLRADVVIKREENPPEEPEEDEDDLDEEEP